MKKMKKILCAVLVFAMAVTMLCGVTPDTEVMAKSKVKTYNMTMAVGESTFISNYRDVKSFTNSKKSIVSAKVNKEHKWELSISAKKKGTTTITVKTKKGSYKYVIKVVKPSFTFNVLGIDKNYVYYSVTNNTEVAYDYVYGDCIFKNSEGEVVDTTKHIYINNLGANKTGYCRVSYDSYDYNVDATLSQVKFNKENSSHYPRYKYTDRTKKLDVSVDEDKENRKISIKYKSSYGDYMYAAVDIVFYDAEDNIVYIMNDSYRLAKKVTYTNSKSIYTDYDHFKVFKRGYSKISVED